MAGLAVHDRLAGIGIALVLGIDSQIVRDPVRGGVPATPRGDPDEAMTMDL